MSTHSPSRPLRSLLTIAIGSSIALVSLAGCAQTCTTNADASQTTEQIVRTVSEQEALADFDTMWQIINDTHFDPQFNGVDWNAVKEEFRPQAAQATNRRQIRRIMSDAMGRLGQSHFGIIPGAPSASIAQMDDAENNTPSATDAVIPQSSNDGSTDGQGESDTGIDVRIIDGQAVVSSIRDQSPAYNAGIKTGWILKLIRDSSVSEGLATLAESVDEDEVGIHGVGMVTNRLQGPEGSTIDLTFLNGHDEEVTIELTRAPMPGEFVQFGNLPPLSTNLDYSRFTRTRDDGSTTEIGVISFNIWMMPIAAKFERAMYELRDVDGIIIDLRGNPGGIGALSSAIGRFIMDEPGSLGTMKMRGADLSFNITPVIITTWGERLNPFTGPVAVLSDSGTASTSEVFAGGLQSLGRIEVFGTRSAGMALPAGMEKLPSGDVLLHAIADFVTSTGYQLEHGGVVPEHIIPLTRSDLLKGIDSPKEAAAEWIQRSIME